MSEERRYGPNAATLDEIDRGPYPANYREIDLVAHIRELMDENAALKADTENADMYKWLRNQHWDHSALAVVSDPKRNVKLGAYCPSGDQLDEFIREAMKASRE